MNKAGKVGDAVKHPNHYCFSKFEPKDVIREWGLNFNLGSAVKYITRAGRKEDIVQDLKKAQEFIQFEIDAIEEERAKQVFPDHPNCRCTHNPYIGADDFMDALVYGLDAILEDIMQEEALSVKPILAKVPDGVDVDEFIKQITKGLEKAVLTPMEDTKKEEHITPVTWSITGNMKTVRFMGNAVEVPKDIPLPEALFFLLEHYVPDEDD